MKRLSGSQVRPIIARAPLREQALETGKRLDVDTAVRDLGGNPHVAMHLYPDTGHAFARESAATDAPAMRELANGRTRAFLEANLG